LTGSVLCALALAGVVIRAWSHQWRGSCRRGGRRRTRWRPDRRARTSAYPRHWRFYQRIGL